MASRNKIYYPKSQIVENLHTIGKEWMLEDGTEYKGYYHRYIDNLVMTGATYSKYSSKRLIVYVDKAAQSDNFIYDKLVRKELHFAPRQTLAVPKLADYTVGKITRYFMQQRNSLDNIFEVDEVQTKQWKPSSGGIDKNLYNLIELDWKLTGPLYDEGEVFGVLDTNRRIVHLKNREMVGLNNFLTDYTELSIHSPYVSKDIKQLFGA
jgi:hypothetical protein